MYLWGGQMLVVDGKMAVATACCCGEGTICPDTADFSSVTFGGTSLTAYASAPASCNGGAAPLGGLTPVGDVWYVKTAVYAIWVFAVDGTGVCTPPDTLEYNVIVEDCANPGSTNRSNDCCAGYWNGATFVVPQPGIFIGLFDDVVITP